MRKKNIIKSHRFRWVRGIVPLLTLLIILLSGYTVTASAPGYAMQEQDLDSVAPGEVVRVDFALSLPQYGSISGAVADAETGMPVPDAAVSACHIPDPAAQVEICSETVTTDAGLYVLTDVTAGGGYAVTASAAGYYLCSEIGITVPADTVVQVDLSLTPEFPDVPRGYWAFDAVGACAAAGVVAGYQDGLYYPGMIVTRDQMAVYMSRALAGGEAEVPDFTGTPAFLDVGEEH